MDTDPRQPQQSDPLPLSPLWAFVVQFQADTDVRQARLSGRVEHVLSGRVRHFASLEDLLAFVAEVLATVRSPPTRE